MRRFQVSFYGPVLVWLIVEAGDKEAAITEAMKAFSECALIRANYDAKEVGK